VRGAPPFGGNGRSGNGSRQSGIWVLDQFTRWQSMNWDFSGSSEGPVDVATVEPTLDYRLRELTVPRSFPATAPDCRRKAEWW